MVKVAFLGTPEFSVPTLRAIHEHPQFEVAVVICQPDRPAGRGKKLRPPATKVYAEANGIPVLQPLSLKREKEIFINNIRQLDTLDTAVVVAFGQILPSWFLSEFHHGCINVHASLLPRWRGAAPLQRCLMAGDTETGVCLMQMDEGLDTGPVYCVDRVEIPKTMNCGELHDLLAKKGAEQVKRCLGDIIAGKLTPVPQCTNGVTYATKITKAELQLVWDNDVQYLRDRVRAFAPHPGAFTTLRSHRLKILSVEQSDHSLSSECNLKRGQVHLTKDDACLVRCRNGFLALKHVQPEGKRVMEVKEFIRGGGLRDGDLFA
jgi:methionyl-tRNA formyltransferase